MPASARGDLRRVRHRQHLHARGKPREPLPDCVRDRAADARVDFVEDERRRRAAIGEHDFQRQHEAREFAARRDLHQRARPRARIGLHPELDAIHSLGPRRGRLALICVEKRAFSSFSGGSSPFTALSSCGAAFRAPCSKRAGSRCEFCVRLLRRLAQCDERASPASSAASSSAYFWASAARSSDRHGIFARRRRATRTAAPRCAPVRADRRRSRAAPMDGLRRGVDCV